MAEGSVRELENAAQIVLAPPHVVTAEERHGAENVFLTFRKSQMPYVLCRYILDNCKNEYVVFQAASTIKEAVVREWALLQPSDVESLRTYLLHYVTQTPELQNYVREQVLQAVSVIFKRGTVDERYTNRDALFADITQLVASGNLSLQLVACSILTALLNEYSTTSRSSSVGLTWEFHSRCKAAFEQSDLKKVFTFCLQVLQELERVEPPASREVTAVFNRVLSITEHVLSWEFLPKHIPRRLIGSFSSSHSNVSFKPPSSWRDLVLDKGLLDLMFKVHRKVRYNSEMCHHSLQCLSQLASLNGAVFSDDKARAAYLAHFLQAFLQLLTETKLQDYEALGIANVTGNLLLFFPMSVTLNLPKDLLTAFLNNLAKMTCDFCQAAAWEDAMHKDDTLFMEAFEKALEAWMHLMTDCRQLPDAAIHQHAVNMFNSFLQCHISSPDGTRNQSADGDLADLEDEYDEMEEMDRERFKDQLCAIGSFGRQVAEHSVPLLARLMEERVRRLHGQLQRLQQQRSQAPTQSPGHKEHQFDTKVLNSVNEDLHWLLLVSANVLTEEAEGETPMIPSPIMQYSVKQTQNINISTTLKVLASPGSSIQDIAGGEQDTDPVVRLISAVFRLCEVERRAIEAQMACYLSPEVGSSAMWFLRRWVQAYLLPNETYYNQISMPLNMSFGRDTDGGQWTVSFLIDKIITNLGVWSAEVRLVDDSLEVLVALVEKKERCDSVAKCNNLWKLAKDFTSNLRHYDNLPASSRRLLCKALIMVGSSTFDDSNREDFWQLSVNCNRQNSGQLLVTMSGKPSQIGQLAANPSIESDPGVVLCLQVLQSLNDRFKAVAGRPGLAKVIHEADVKKEVMGVLECLCGVSEATRVDNVGVLFNFLHPSLVESVRILDLYHSYTEVVELVLEFFDCTTNRQICYLGQRDTRRLYEVCLSMVQTYAKHNIGRRTLSRDAEEEQFQDLLTLMDMLTNLLSKDFIDFALTGEDDTAAGDSVSAADVVLYGMNIIVPLMSAELLKFPELCTAYMRLIAYIGEIFPEKICQLPEDLSKALMHSVTLGLTSFGPDIVKLCLEFVSSMATQVYQHEVPTENLCNQAMAHFLEVVFHMLLLETFDMDLIETVSTTFFTLICCHKENFRGLVAGLLDKQTDPATRQRLVEAFHNLTPPELKLNIDRANRIQFMQNFDQFLVNVRGFLCVK